MQNALFKQRGVRMASSTGVYLLSAYDEDIAVDHRPAGSARAAMVHTRHPLAVIAFESRVYYSYESRPVFGLVVAIDGLVVAISIKPVVLFGGTDTPRGPIRPPRLYASCLRLCSRCHTRLVMPLTILLSLQTTSLARRLQPSHLQASRLRESPGAVAHPQAAAQR